MNVSLDNSRVSMPVTQQQGPQVPAPTQEEINQFVEDTLAPHVETYTDHAQDLHWRMATLGQAMSPDQLETAMEAFVAEMEDQHPGWEAEFEENQQQVVEDGRRLIEMLGHPDLQSLSAAERQEILDTVLEEHPEAQMAVLAALGDPAGVDPEQLDAAMGFFESVDLAGKAPSFANALGQAYLKQVQATVSAVDPYDPQSVTDAHAAVQTLRDSNYRALLNLPVEEFNALIDAIDLAVPGPGVSEAELQSRLGDVAEAADALDDAVDGASVTQGLRLLALGAGAVGLYQAGSTLFDDPNPETALRALTELVGLASDTTEILVGAGVVAQEGRVAATLGSPVLGKVLGAVGLVFGGVDLYRNIRDGDAAQAALTTIGMGAAALAAFGTTSWAGPVGIAIGVFAAAGTIGLSQWRNVDASNEYMNDTSSEFLQHAGFAPDVADALVDQSSEGHSPVPFLFAYADSIGLSRQETIDWLNGLPPADLESIRDRAHEVLDSIDGDLGRMEGTPDQGTLDFLASYRQARGGDTHTHDQGRVFTLGTDTRVVEAGTWEEFTALIEAKNRVAPSTSLDGNGPAMDLETATQTLLDGYDTVNNGGDGITAEDLARIRDDAGADLQLRRVAEFLLDSQASRSFLDVGQGEGSVDGNISRDDVEAALETIRSGDYETQLFDTASGRGGRDDNISDDDLAAAQHDAGLTDAQRATAAEMLADRS